jgi:hypothetical protein
MGGLPKVAHCAYLYDWLDLSDRAREANAFFQQIRAAIDTYRHNPLRHAELMRTAMNVNASWDCSATQYIHMYRYGLLYKKWEQARQQVINHFSDTLGDEQTLFSEFFMPGQGEYGDTFNWQLKQVLAA